MFSLLSLWIKPWCVKAIDQCFPVISFIMLLQGISHLLSLYSVDSVTIRKKAIEQCFSQGHYFLNFAKLVFFEKFKHSR